MSHHQVQSSAQSGRGCCIPRAHKGMQRQMESDIIQEAQVGSHRDIQRNSE